MYRKGFTLVELAIVLIIIGVMTAGGIIGVNSAINSSRFNSTKNQIEGVLKSIAEYSATGQRIPSDDTEIQTFLSPFTDNFGNNIIYIPAPELTDTGSICNTENTSLTVRQCNDANCLTSSNYDDIAFFVSSRSINGASEINIGANDIDLFDNSINSNYDDITGFLTLSSLKAFAGCEGSTIQIIEDKLPTAYTMSNYKASFNAKGGTAPYSWCLESNDDDIRTYFLLGSHSLSDTGDCGSSGSFQSTTSGSITLLSNNSSDENRLPTEVFENANKVKLYVRDSSGGTASKSYSMTIKDYYEEIVPSGNNYTIGNFGEDEWADPTEAAIINVDENGDLQIINDDDISAIQGSKVSCIWTDFETEPSFKASKMAAYFELDMKELQAAASNGNEFYGLTFATIDATKNTSGVCGAKGDDLGYGGIPGSNFAVEFDTYKDNSKHDPNDDHIAIDSTNGSTGLTKHGDHFNDNCSTNTNDGCYYNNNYKIRNKKMAVRVEAYQGCQSNGTNCTGSMHNLFNCVDVWVKDVTAAGTSVDDNYKNLWKFDKFDHHMTESKIATDCYQFVDSKELDAIRVGFTVAGNFANHDDFILYINDFSANIVPYAE